MAVATLLVKPCGAELGRQQSPSTETARLSVLQLDVQGTDASESTDRPTPEGIGQLTCRRAVPWTGTAAKCSWSDKGPWGVG